MAKLSEGQRLFGDMRIAYAKKSNAETRARDIEAGKRKRKIEKSFEDKQFKHEHKEIWE